jgi:hypothetical protein
MSPPRTGRLLLWKAGVPPSQSRLPQEDEGGRLPALLERAVELDRLGSLVRRAGAGRGGGCEGPGICKTRLGEEAAAVARAEGFTVLSACGSWVLQPMAEPDAALQRRAHGCTVAPDSGKEV